MSQALAPLRLPGFRQLTFAYTVNELGNWLGEIALAVLVFEQTGSPLATAALFIGMQFLPAFVSQGVVARIEMAGSRVALPAIYAAEAATFVVLAIVAGQFMLWLIIVLAIVDGTFALAGRALTRAAAAAVLKPSGQLREGNALLNIGFTVAGAIGPAAAGLVVAAFGVRAALLVDAASFLAAAIALATARSLPRMKASREHWRERLRQGYAYVGGRPILRRLLIAQAAAFVFFAAVIPIEIVYAKETLDAGDSGYGALLAAWGIGMVVGSLVFAAFRRAPLPLLLFIGTIAVGAAYLGLAAAQTIYVACAVATIGGAGNGVQWVSIVSAIQGLTASAYQARVVGLLESIGRAMPGVGFLLGGVIAFVLDPRASFLVAGAGVLAVVAAMAPLLSRTDWAAETPEEPTGQIEASRAVPAANLSGSFSEHDPRQEADRPTHRVTIDASSWAEDSS
jgi:MFS family permease